MISNAYGDECTPHSVCRGRTSGFWNASPGDQIPLSTIFGCRVERDGTAMFLERLVSEWFLIEQVSHVICLIGKG